MTTGLEIGFEKLPRDEQIYKLSVWGVSRKEIKQQFAKADGTMLSKTRVYDIIRTMAVREKLKNAKTK